METKLYILFEENGRVTGSNYFKEGEQPELSTDVLPTVTYIEGYFDRVNKVYFEGATQEQLAEAKKASVPETVSRRQLRLALVLSSFDLSMIDAQINQLPEPNRSFALIAWNDAIVFERKDALLNQLAGQLGLTEDNLDDLFINASKL
ncbi:hypothetical protein [Flavobacterium mekongense]|uniref:hypothetical protein n=1 Tax=Flavobacterium mekongense TaxID=3379707 RepID=UPI00399A75A3